MQNRNYRKRGRTVSQRFWDFVDLQDGSPGVCWLWTGATIVYGYGMFGIERGKSVRPHRWAYEDLVGPLPKGMQTHHTCFTPACVNPAHLQVLTPQEHRDLHAGDQRITHCKNGHEMTPENTRTHTENYAGRERTRRRCKTCERVRDGKRPRRGRPKS